MTYLTLDEVKQPLQRFEELDADAQLALLWYGYQDIKESLNPNPGHQVEGIARAAYNRVKLMAKDDQLQAQRDIANRADTLLSREYGAMSPSAKLEFWLLLAQGMDSGEIIDVPADYRLPPSAQELATTTQELSFEQRINFLRNAVAKMGLNPSIA